MQGQLKSEAALLLEVFSRIFDKVDAKELLIAKQLPSSNSAGSRYKFCPIHTQISLILQGHLAQWKRDKTLLLMQSFSLPACNNRKQCPIGIVSTVKLTIAD